MNAQQSGKSGKKTYYVDEEACIGCGICATVCPHGYEMQPNGKSKATIVTPTDDEKMEEAKSVCPVGAIKYRED